MAKFYDRADIYDLFENENRYNANKKHWETIFSGKNIRSVLDVSIGSGTVTLPMLDLGIALSGSDLSESMLENCRKKSEARGCTPELKCSDFRDLSCWGDAQYDCVACTGNSLPYVKNEDALKTLEQMDSHVAPGGYLYLDMRNWDKILRDKPRFYLYNPMFHGENRVNVVQAWDYNADGSMTFNILYTFEKDNRIFQKEIFEEHYNPLSKALVLNKLKEMGYSEIEIKAFPSFFEVDNIEEAEWHGIIAKKSKEAK